MEKRFYCTPVTEVMEVEFENYLLAASGEGDGLLPGDGEESEVGGDVGDDGFDAKTHNCSNGVW